VGRLTDALRRRLKAGSATPPATLPGFESGEEAAVAAAARDAPGPPAEPEPPAEADQPGEPEPEPEPATEPEAGARIDAARERLRAKIQPPADPGDTD
jgi:hypothetical protein